jgi:hypothetical protein
MQEFFRFLPAANELADEHLTCPAPTQGDLRMNGHRLKRSMRLAATFFCLGRVRRFSLQCAFTGIQRPTSFTNQFQQPKRKA